MPYGKIKIVGRSTPGELTPDNSFKVIDLKVVKVPVPIDPPLVPLVSNPSTPISLAIPQAQRRIEQGFRAGRGVAVGPLR